MTGRRQIERFVRANRDPRGLDHERFTRTGGKKVQCALCGRTGYGPVGPVEDVKCFDGRVLRWQDRFSPWQIGCLMPHDWFCSCGLRFVQFADLWRHVGADRPAGWGRQGIHAPVLSMAVAA